MLQKLIHKIALTCKEATFLMELENTINVSSLQKIRLQLHLKICKACKSYQKNSKLLEKVLEMSFYKNHDTPVNQEKIKQLKVKIIQNLPNNE